MSMSNKSWIISVMTMLLALGLLAGHAQAADAAADAKRGKDAPKSAKDDARLAELQKQFKARDPKLRELKRSGTIGETSEGLIDFVEQRDPDAADVVSDENRDRKALYAILAEQEGIEAAVVAARSAKRNFQRARAGEFLKEGGKWKKKEEAKKS